MKFLEFLQEPGGAYDLFHVLSALLIVAFVFLQVMDAAHHGWRMPEDFGMNAGLVVTAAAGAFPLRSMGQK